MEAAERKRTKIALTAALILMGAALLLSVCVGKYPISVREIIDLLAGREVKTLMRDVFFTLRLPRTLMALFAGLALGMAGSVYQTIFKNPLAAPDIIGMASGANLGAACAIVLAGSAAMTVALGAFGGGILAVLFVMLLVRVTNSRSTATYVLAGRDVAVIGLPDARLGEIAAAVIAVREGETLTEAEVQRFCEELPRYKRPRKIIFADVPRNPTGKIEKTVLRERYGRGRLVEAQTIS